MRERRIIVRNEQKFRQALGIFKSGTLRNNKHPYCVIGGLSVVGLSVVHLDKFYGTAYVRKKG